MTPPPLHRWHCRRVQSTPGPRGSPADEPWRPPPADRLLLAGCLPPRPVPGPSAPDQSSTRCQRPPRSGTGDGLRGAIPCSCYTLLESECCSGCRPKPLASVWLSENRFQIILILSCDKALAALDDPGTRDSFETESPTKPRGGSLPLNPARLAREHLATGAERLGSWGPAGWRNGKIPGQARGIENLLVRAFPIPPGLPGGLFGFSLTQQQPSRGESRPACPADCSFLATRRYTARIQLTSRIRCQRIRL